MGYDPEGSGYHFRRREFDPEWDNDAEATIADMEFNDFDTEEDRRLKLRTLEIYNRRMDERERRRDILLAHNLIKVKRDQAQEKRLNPQERELMARLRVFARYEDVSECSHEEFAEGVLVEHRLRARIKELQEQRRNGIRTLAQGDAFEAERKRSAEEDPAVASGVNPGPKSLAHSLTAFRAQRGLPLDLTSLPGVEHLTRKEREHCAMHRLLPAHYLGLKDIALRDAQKNGAITKQEAKSSFRLDPGKSLKLFEFWASMGWIEFATNE
jgi:transcriptional adapter 2-alpha